MKKNGFTLIELLAVIIVLSVIALIAFPQVIDSVNSSKEKLYKEQVKRILDAADSWASENDSRLPDNNDSSTPIKITINDLQIAGLLKNETVKNPIDSSINMNSNKIVIYFYSAYNQYVAAYCESNETYARLYYTTNEAYNKMRTECAKVS